MEFEVSYSLESEEQFWDELDDIVSARCETHELIDNALRGYLSFTTKFRDDYLASETALAHCSLKLLDSPLFVAHKEYVRRQLVYGLLQEDDAPTLHLIAALLLLDGRVNAEPFEMMQGEGAFPRLVELIQSPTMSADLDLHRVLLELAYEMSRIQRLGWEDLMAIDDPFILFLFQLVEELSFDASDPYHSHVIRLLLVLNEQYMVYSTSQPPSTSPTTGTTALPNRVLKALATHGHRHKTFGENLILLLNRESETSQQLLILKLLYLVFTSRATAEYFYTNDLHVLVDVLLRNLLDLPVDDDNDSAFPPPADGEPAAQPRATPLTALRHTHLRVLHPLLVHSQIARPPHYKRAEISRLLHALARAPSSPDDPASPNDADTSPSSSMRHFAPADPTTVRLARRCLGVAWLREETVAGEGERVVARRVVGGRRLGGGHPAAASAESVVEVAAQMERPGVMTPRRGAAKGSSG